MSEEAMKKIPAPKVTKDATEKLVRKMYISNVTKRLRELNAPTDLDRKRWVWELIQNAKDTIAGDSKRDRINVRIEIEGDTVRFRHDGNPFTPDARFALLYKYSEDKENQESTGRFGTGFLTTHCLSKIVSIESNMFRYEDDKHTLCGFRVTMYRDGQIERELLDGLNKMQASEEFYENTFEWTTFTYHVSTDSGRKAIKLGVENFHENIAQTMLFCNELASVELNDNGKVTNIIRKPVVELTDGVNCAEFEIHGEDVRTRKFLYSSFCEHNEELSTRYRADRNIRINAVIEVDSNNNIVNHSGSTSHYCVFPLIGIESQLDEPLIVNSPDFEPDSERQSLLLAGQDWNDESNNITETGINHLIYEKIFPLYEKLVKFMSVNHYGNLYLLANGLKKAKEHNKSDAAWYMENVIKKYREILLKYAVVESYDGTNFKLLTDCIIVKESKIENENSVFNIISKLYPQQLVKNNHDWAQYVWKDGLNTWGTKDLCSNIESYSNWDSIPITENTELSIWYNDFLAYINLYDELLLKEHALLPNMNGLFLKKDADDFKQGENVNPFVIELLYKLGKDVKPILLNDRITVVKLDAKYTSQSFSADINKLAKSIIDKGSIETILQQLMPLLSVIPTDSDYDATFIKRRTDFYNIAKSLFGLSDATYTNDNSLLDAAWKEVDIWFVTFVLQHLKNKIGKLSALPEGLDAKWLNEALKSLKIEPNRLNSYEVLPNQNGDFCKQERLYEDQNIPEELKNEVFNKISLRYKDILLHKDIEASEFAISLKRDITDFARDLKSEIEPIKNCSYGNYFYDSYHKHSQEAIEAVSLYMLSIQPKDRESDIYNLQNNLLLTARELLPNRNIPVDSDIDYDARDLWRDTNFVVANIISYEIKNSQNIDSLNEKLGNCGEAHIFELLNSFYDFLQESKFSYDAPVIFLNQHGEFHPIRDLKKEEGQIDDVIKDIISYMVAKDEDYRHVLMDKRSLIQPQQSLNSDTAYALIDEKIHESYDRPSTWSDEKFIDAAQLLIEDWGDKHDGTFKEKFPRTYPDKEKILMNVVWKKDKRELMMDVSKKFTENQLKLFSEKSAEIMDLIENKIINAPKPVEIQITTPKGENKLTVEEAQYAGLTKEEIIGYVSEAKMAVVNYYKDLEEKTHAGYTFDDKRIGWDSYSQLYGIYNPKGREMPLVVHSYKGPQYRCFDLNWYDWQRLSEPDSMLWVLTTSGLQCIPLYALPVINVKIPVCNLTRESQTAVLTLASVVKQHYCEISFDFGNRMPQGFNEPLPFNKVPKELGDCIDSIKQICDDSIPSIAHTNVFTYDTTTPLIETKNYSEAREEIKSGLSMREIHDLPANDDAIAVGGANPDTML